MNSSKLEHDTRMKRLNAAFRIDVDWEQILDRKIYATVLGLTLSAGTPIDFFLFPLLSITASLMNGATILANKKTDWREPSIIWTVISAPAGSKKSSAMKVFTKCVHALYDTPDESRDLFETLDGDETTRVHRLPGPYMINAVFTMPALFSKIDNYNGQYLLLFDEMTLLFKNIDKDAKESPMRQIFLSLANGDSITRSTTTAGEEFIRSTNVNFSGFIQPDKIFEQVQRGDPDGFLARMLIVTPRLVSFKYDDYGTTDDGIDLQEILSAVKSHHSERTMEYQFGVDALPHFKAYHDQLVDKATAKNILDEADERAVILKTPGQCARLSMVLEALSNVTADKPTNVISKETVKRAVLLSQYILDQKLALISDPLSPTPVAENPPILTRADLLKEKPKVARALTNSIVSARELSQKRLVPQNISGDRCSGARHLISELARNGFGEMVEGRNSSVVLKRKHYKEMEMDTQRLFDELEIDQSIYNRAAESDAVKRKKRIHE